MAFAWMFLPHVIRGIIGLIIVLVKGLPKSDEIIEHVKIENISTLETLKEDIGKGVISYIKEKSGNLKSALLAYTILSILCYAFDCITFLIMFRYFGVDGKEKAETILLISSICFWVMSLGFLTWITRLKYRLPSKLYLGV